MVTKKNILIIVLLIGISIIGYITSAFWMRTFLSIQSYITGTQYVRIHESEGKYIRQIITSNIDESRMIMWQSDISETNAIVEVREVNSNEIISFMATNREFIDDGETSFIHEALITSLDSKKAYEYRIGYDKKRSDWIHLKGISSPMYKVLIYPDSQSADYTDWASIVKSSYEANKDSLFYISMGDLVDNGEQASQWRAWFNAVSPLRTTMPVAPLLGNHETYNLNWKIREPIAYLNYFNLPSNNNETYKNRYYSFNVGPVHYIVLDTQMKEETEFHPNILETQLKWLREDLSNNLKTNTTNWTIVLMHKDTFKYANNRNGGDPGFNDIGKTFMPIFDEFKVDVVLSAHLHTYRNRGHVKNFIRDEEGPLYILTGVAGDVRYANLWKNHPLDVVVAPQPETNNYMTMDVSDKELRIRSFLPDGTVIDDVKISK